MNLFSITYPASLIILLIGFIVGITASFIFFGFFAIIVVIILLCIGSLRIMPIINLISNILYAIFPNTIDLLINNISNSFPVYYSQPNMQNDKYIYIFHPHGMFSLSHYMHVGTNMTKWTDKSTKGAMLNTLQWLPFSKELMEVHNLVPSTYNDMKNVLKTNSLSVTLGGVKEIALTTDNKLVLNIAKKRGIFKMALETGTSIIPIIAYGENELYKLHTFWLFKYINNLLLKINLHLPFPKWESCVNWIKLFNRPLETPVKTYVGEPISVNKIESPSDKDIIELREQYFTALKKLYADTKPEYYDSTLYIV
jgi:hypothetical protein